jgi:division protein CdvB (Snf7/Vps24/ESCRT-III family)
LPTLGPTAEVIRIVKSKLGKLFPEAENELGEIENILRGIMIEASQKSETTFNSEAFHMEANKILTEAATEAKQKLKRNTPDRPTKMPQNTRCNQRKQTINSIKAIK